MATEVTTSSQQASDNFQQLLLYCRQVLGDRQRVASKRELSDALGVAPGMAGRYIAGETDFYNLRAVTVELLARACSLDVGSVFIWVREGREAAMAHEELLRREPVTFTALDHVRVAARLLELQEQQQLRPGVDPVPLSTDFEGLVMALAARRGPDGGALAGLFDTLVQTIDAAACLDRISAARELGDEDWFKLQQLLGVQESELRQLYGPGRTRSRTEPLPA